jgi:hypothetical protein
MKPFRCIVGSLGLAGILLGAQIRPLTIEDLATRAARICHGRVESVEVVREASGNLVTRVEIDARAMWKGSPTNRITVTQPGGTLGNRRVVIPGAPNFALGEEVVVFLSLNPRGEWLTLDLAQGKFSVDRQGSNAWVRNVVLGGSPTPGGFRPPHHQPLPLETLRDRVTEALQ